MSRDPIEVDETTGEAKSGNAIRKLYGEGRAEAVAAIAALPVPVEIDELNKVVAGKEATLTIEPASQMQHVAGSVLRRGRAHANEYGAELVVITIEREPKPEAALEGFPAPGYAFGMASTSDDDETIALALRAIASRLERT